MEGFVYDNGIGIPAPYIGVFSGNTNQASRENASITVPKAVISGWATKQGELIDRTKYPTPQLVAAAEYILRLGGNPGDLPFCFHEGKIKTYDEISGLLRDSESVHVIVERSYESNFRLLSIWKMKSNLFAMKTRRDVFALNGSTGNLFPEDFINKFTANRRADLHFDDLEQSGSLEVFIRLVMTAWGCVPQASVQVVCPFDTKFHVAPENNWTLEFRKPSPLTSSKV